MNNSVKLRVADTAEREGQTTEVGIANQMREKVLELEQHLSHFPQVNCEIVNHFSPGVYAREMRIPAGSILTGAVHKTEHLCIISCGKIAVTTDDGVVVITAPSTIISKPGTKRAGFAIEDTVWITVHGTTETDMEKLCAELTESTLDQLAGGQNNIQIKNGGSLCLGVL